MKIDELIGEISDRPASKRVQIVEAILDTLNGPNHEIEAAWTEEVYRRAQEVENGGVEMIPGEQVMGELKDITG